jgi:hypothetical protein
MYSLPDREVRALQKRVIACLAERYLSLTGIEPNAKHQVSRARDAVVRTLADGELEQSLADVRLGSGGELKPPKSGGQPDFHSVRSSCALAVSVFGPWRLQPMNLKLAGATGFTRLQFEVKFPILDGVKSFKTPPNLDVVGWHSDGVVAVESKFVEQINPKHTASFDDLYDDAIKSANPTWQGKVKLLRANANAYRFFDAAQIVKHYLGLKADRPGLIQGRPTTLLYMYWEPEDPGTHHFFAQHKAEAADFREGLSDDNVSFAFLSYRELWNDWKAMTSPDLQRHVSALEARYLLNLSVCTAR